MTPILPFVLVAFAAFGAFFAYREYQRRVHARWRAVAARHGLEVDVATKQPPPLDFDLFDDGRGKKVTAQMWRAREEDSVFQYEYTTGSGEHSTTHRRSVALVQVPFRAPHLVISSEDWWSKLKRAVGMRDIELESPEFNDRYRVRCDDERFAVTLLDPATVAWMLSPASGRGAVTFEFGGTWLLCFCDQLDVESLPGLLAWAQSARHQFPTVLTDLYGR